MVREACTPKSVKCLSRSHTPKSRRNSFSPMGQAKTVVVADGDSSQARLESFFRPRSSIVSRKRQSGEHKPRQGASTREDIRSPRDLLRGSSNETENTSEGTGAHQGLKIQADRMEGEAGASNSRSGKLGDESEENCTDPKGFFNAATVERPPEEITYRKRIRLTEDRCGSVHRLRVLESRIGKGSEP
eukprot:1187229-Prorocentrum_minimum.AAC.2